MLACRSLGPVLRHDVDERVGRNLLGQEPKDLASLIESTWHDQMPHEQTPAGQPMLVENRIAHLSVHFLDRRPCHDGASCRPTAWR